MSGGKGSAPQPPDPYEVAGAQTQTNVNTALAQAALNQYEEVNPYGRTYYEPTGDVRTFGFASGPGGGGSMFGGDEDEEGGRRFQGQFGGGQQSQFEIPTYRRITEFSPEQQRIFESEMGLTGDLYDLAADYTGRVAEGLDTPFNYEGLPDAPVADADARQQVIDSLYGQYQSRLDPRFEKEQRALQTQLANQGISIDSDAYRSAMGQFGRTQNDAYQSALNQAVTAGGAEQSRMFGLQGSARARAIQERAYLRDRPINEITALTSGRGLTMPQFSATPQTGIAGTDLQGAVYNSYQGQLQAHQMAQQSRNALIGALAGGVGKIGGAFLGNPGLLGG